MRQDQVLTVISLSIFFFVWLPVQHARHKKRMRSLVAINKGTRFSRKYRALKKLNRS